jgi:pyruvate dehydrogenase E1 component alpha subunit
MPGATADGNDVVDVYERVLEATERARSGGGPTLVEAITYRYRGHSKSDRNLYRTQEEIEGWRSQRDPIMRFEGKALEEGLLDAAAIDAATAAARETIRDAIQTAFAQPDATTDDLEESAYA